jgi:hypothetical protein
VRGYLIEALAIVSELELSDDLRQLAFSKAVDLLAAKQIVLEQSPVPVPQIGIPRNRRH